MIRVRNDDVLLPSRSHKDPLGRVQQMHEWMCEVPNHLIHVPTILCTEIQQFPKAISWIKEETTAGRMLPEIHGKEHIDYAKLSEPEIKEHMHYCINFIRDNFNHDPKFFYTPWGANAPHIHKATAECGLTLIDTSVRINLDGEPGMVNLLKHGHPWSEFDGREIMIHWWAGGARLKRVVEVAKYGSWGEAAKHNKKLFQGA